MDTLLLLALVVQVVTEAIARVYPRGTVYVATGVGLAVGFLGNIGLMQALNLEVSNHYVDVALAGLVLAGGSGLIERLKQRITPN